MHTRPSPPTGSLTTGGQSCSRSWHLPLGTSPWAPRGASGSDGACFVITDAIPISQKGIGVVLTGKIKISSKSKKGNASTCQKWKAFQTWTLQPNAETMGHPSCRPCCCTLHTRRLESRLQVDPRTPVCVAAHGRSTPSRSARSTRSFNTFKKCSIKQATALYRRSGTSLNTSVIARSRSKLGCVIK